MNGVGRRLGVLPELREPLRRERALLSLEVLGQVQALRGDVGGLGELIERRAREIAREEIASLAGLVLGRLGELEGPVVGVTGMRAIFGEVLNDFGGTESEPGGST